MNNNLSDPEPNFFPWSWLVLSIFVALVIGGGLIYYYKVFNPDLEKSTAIISAKTSSSSTTITNDTDLQGASKELDGVNLNTLDSGLTQNDTDASQF